MRAIGTTQRMSYLVEVSRELMEIKRAEALAAERRRFEDQQRKERELRELVASWNVR